LAKVPAAEETSGKLSVSEISVSFGGITALDGVSLEVSQGEVRRALLTVLRLSLRRWK